MCSRLVYSCWYFHVLLHILLLHLQWLDVFFGLPLPQYQLVILHTLFHYVWFHLHVQLIHNHLYFRFNFHLYIHNLLLSANNWDVITLLTCFKTWKSWFYCLITCIHGFNNQNVDWYPGEFYSGVMQSRFQIHNHMSPLIVQVHCQINSVIFS